MRPRVGFLAAIVLLVGATGSCAGSRARPRSVSYAPGITDVTEMVALDNGSVRVALRSGTVEDVAPGGAVTATLAHLDVRTDGQRGLLGIAVDASGRTFAEWTRPDGRLVVGQVAPGSTRTVWVGPTSADLANGGHLAFRNGGLVIAIGDLLENTKINDPATLNGKFFTLDPDGAPNQQPRRISSGWNNPFAFTVLADGSIWVADNAPGDTGERLIRADVTTEPVELPQGTAPAGIDHVGSDRLVVCGFKSHALLSYRLRKGRPGPRTTLAEDCATAVVALRDGRVVYAAADGLRALSP